MQQHCQCIFWLAFALRCDHSKLNFHLEVKSSPNFRQKRNCLSLYFIFTFFLTQGDVGLMIILFLKVFYYLPQIKRFLKRKGFIDLGGLKILFKIPNLFTRQSFLLGHLMQKYLKSKNIFAIFNDNVIMLL